MGILNLLRKIVRPETERPKRKSQSGELSDPLSDPLEMSPPPQQVKPSTSKPKVTPPEVQPQAPGEGTTWSNELKKAGGKSWNKKSNYASILSGLSAMDGPELNEGQRHEAAMGLREKIQEWANKHGTDSKRGQALANAYGKLSRFGFKMQAGGDNDMSEALEHDNPTLKALTIGHERAKVVGQDRDRLRKEAGKVRDTDPARWEQLTQQIAGQEKLKTVVSGSVSSLEQKYLERQVEKSGLKGGKSKSMIGSGAMGSAHKAQFGDKELIFKATEGMGDVMQDAGMTAEVGPMRAVASSVVNDMLGTSVIGKTQLAEMDGTHGIAMEEALGKSTRRKAKVTDLGIKDQSVLKDANYASGSEIFLDNGVDYSDPVVQKGLIDLQINDVISGQLDRHAGNYHVQYGENGEATSVNAFDNDMAFGSNMGDWNGRLQEKSERSGDLTFGNAVEFPPLMSEDQAEKVEKLDIEQLRDQLSQLLPTAEVEAAVERARRLREHVGSLRENGKIVEKYDQGTYQELMNEGERKSYVARDSLQGSRMKELEQKILEQQGN